MPDPARAAAARNYLSSIGVQIPARPRRRVADVPGTIPGLADAYATPAPLSRHEIEANARFAREQEAARQRDTSYDVSPNEMIRDLGIIASDYVPGIERAANAITSASPTAGAVRGVAGAMVPGLAPLMALGDTEYDPVALATSAVPLADEAIAAGEAVAGRRPYRVAQAEWEQRGAEAAERSPGSAMVGGAAQMAVTGPLASGLTLRRGAEIGAGLGAAGGYLGSEGGTATDRAAATLGGALTGGAIGATSGGLMQGGRALATQTAPGLFGSIGRGMLGGALEAEGAGIGTGAIESGGRLGSEEQLRDALNTGAVSAPIGGALGLVGGLARSATRRGAPGLADDVEYTPTDLDETALLDVAEEAAPSISMLTGTGSQRIADLQRLRAAGALDRSTLKKLASAFHPGNAEEGVARAARVARESGISPSGEFQSLDTTLARAARERLRSGQQLGQYHRRIAEGGGVYRGDALAAPLEQRAARFARMRSPDDAVLAEIASLRARADDLRFGSRGLTPEREEMELFRAQEFADPQEIGLQRLVDDIADPSGREVRGMTEREFLRPQVIPYEEGRIMEESIVGRLDPFNRTRAPLDATTAARLQAEHRALVPERNAAARAILGEQEYTTGMRPANERYRLAATLVPENAIPNAAIADPGQLTGAINAAMNDGSFSPSGQASRIGERVFRQFEPSLNAMLAERAASGAPSALGNFAARLRAPNPALAGVAGVGMGAGTESEAATAQSIAELRRIAAIRPRTEAEARAQEEADFALDTLGIDRTEEDPDEIDPLDVLGR
jgi:hypothetical protein